MLTDLNGQLDDMIIRFQVAMDLYIGIIDRNPEIILKSIEKAQCRNAVNVM